MSKPPLWGNFIGFADEDVLSIGMLCAGDLIIPAIYHATQAVEKYLKALILSILDPDGRLLTPERKQWLQTHNLEELASYCSGRYSYYGQEVILEKLRKFSAYDQATRYPWVKGYYEGYLTNSAIRENFEDILVHLRSDLPIRFDDYPLGIAVRGYNHRCPQIEYPDNMPMRRHIAVECLRSVFPRLHEFVRWADSSD